MAPCNGISANLTTLAVFLLALTAVPDTRQFTSGVNVVEVYASVTDAKGEPITGLRRDEFTVRENGVVQQITAFTEADFPLSVALAVDRSFSMQGERLAVAKSAGRIFLGELRPRDEAMLMAIGSQVEVVAPLSTDRAAQFAALSKIDAFGTTGLHDAIIDAIDRVQQAKGRRALVLLSDGNDRYSKASANEALERARRADVMIYPIALGRNRPGLFAELATLTGGRSFHLRDTKQLAETLRGIARDLRQQYLIGYTPAKPIEPGSNEWRAIEVTTTRGDARVRARDGYIAR